MNTMKHNYPSETYERIFGKTRSECAATLTEPIDLQLAEAMARAWIVFRLPAYLQSGVRDDYLANINWYYHEVAIDDLAFLIHDLSLDIIENGA